MEEKSIGDGGGDGRRRVEEGERERKYGESRRGRVEETR